ncbi:MAG: gliding motility protein GldN [Tannerellaceae bacterium]|nr:gliding motility protein GldN [Tannerellaceae bacterium]
MKKLFLISIGIGGCLYLMSQEINRLQRRIPEIVRESEIQPEEIPVDLSVPVRQPVWKRILYRELDLEQPANSSLYYPVRPVEGKRNLTTLIFQAVLSEKLQVYEYIDGYELFEDRYRMEVKEILDKYRISTDPGEMVETPSTEEIRTYYVKECWWIDAHTSTLEKEIEALCPLLSVYENGQSVRRPLFWVRYTDLLPFIKEEKVMLSDLNNSWYYTVEEYFRKGFYKGSIVKTGNLANRTMNELYPDPDSLRIAQEEIEKQLESFKKSLSWSPDSVKSGKKQIRKESVSAPKGVSRPEPVEERTAPVRSVRRR